MSKLLLILVTLAFVAYMGMPEVHKMQVRIQTLKHENETLDAENSRLAKHLKQMQADSLAYRQASTKVQAENDSLRDLITILN